VKASVITPVWNRADLTFNYLNQHQRYYASQDDVEFIIIDNGSTDGTQGVLRAFEDKLNLAAIRLPQNAGFGKANNLGAQRAKGDVLIFLNNDVQLRGDYLSPIIDLLTRIPEAITGAELLTRDTGWNKFGDKIISYIPGWCLAMPRSTFVGLDGFDERYSPGDYEDVDICYTATQQGYLLRALTLPILHLGGQTARQLVNRWAMTERHRKLFAEKWGFNGHEA